MRDDILLLDGPAINSTLTTARLRLEPLDGRHARLLFDGMRDPAIYEWISLKPSPDVDHLEARWARVAQRSLVAVDVLDFGWAVQRVSDGAWIGKMDAEVQAHGVATNVGYAFVSIYWGQGYATEALRALCEHLACHGVTEQRATVTLGNDASCRVLEHAGFVRERVLPNNDMLRGVLVDDVEYVRRDPRAGGG
jgi:ribosomal-protein-alanine N-acetyltransferase